MVKSVKPIIILVCPQMGENIGASARAMKNFGLSELRIVAPRDGWPNPKADSMSVGAVDIIKSAKIYDDLPSAIEDIEFLYATTGVPRSMNKDYIMAHEIGKSHPFELSGSSARVGPRVGIMFGRENCGLTNEEISYANAILSIATAPDFSSLNIAHAVAVVAHSIFTSENSHEIKSIENNQMLATNGELEYFFEHLFGELDSRKFFKVPEKYEHMTHNIRNIFTRINKLSKNELQTLRGIVTTLSK